jgi:DNA-directed RNA polymerase specialized sigma24 family protein
VDTAGFDQLPRAYRLALRLRTLGADYDLIAECLNIDPDSVGTLLDIGARKLEHVKDAGRRNHKKGKAD